MISEFNQTAADIIHEKSLSQCEVLLVLMSTDSAIAFSPKEIKTLAIEHGVVRAKKWNIPAVLTRNPTYFFKTGDGWRLTSAGRKKAEDLGCNRSEAKINNVFLRDLLNELPASPSKDFFEEAVCCHENRCYRGALILAWESSMGVMYEYVLEHCLQEFNSVAVSRNKKWKDAQSFDDFSNMKESVFLEILCTLSVFGKSTKQELQDCLTLRNACSHPNTCSIGSQRVLGCMESLWNNVHLRFLK